MLEDDEELIGLAGLVQDSPAGQVRPTQGNPGYALLKPLEQHEVEELEHACSI